MTDILVDLISTGSLQSLQITWKRHSVGPIREDRADLLKNIGTILKKIPVNAPLQTVAEWIQRDVLPLVSSTSQFSTVLNWINTYVREIVVYHSPKSAMSVTDIVLRSTTDDLR